MPAKIFSVFVLLLMTSRAGASVLPCEITKDSVFSGEIFLDGDVTIARGAEVVFRPGTTVVVRGEKFSKNLEKRIGRRKLNVAFAGKPVIVVNGILKVISTPDLPAVFGKIPATGSRFSLRWGGIVAGGQGRIILENVIIKDAVSGILLSDNANAFLKNCEIKNCGIGIIAGNNSLVRLDNTAISRCATSGIELYDESFARVKNSVIHRMRNFGIFLKQSSRLEMFSSRIRGNKTGIYVGDAAQANLKNNIFQENEKDREGIKEEKERVMSPSGSDKIVWSGFLSLDRDFIVPYGKTLYIKSGAKIAVSSASLKDEDFFIKSNGRRYRITSPGKCDIIVKGDIYIDGTAKKPVIFIGASGFGNVILSGSGKHSVIRNLDFNSILGGFYILGRNRTKFENSAFSKCRQAVVVMDSAKPVFDDCEFVDNKYSLLIYDYSAVSVKNSLFVSNENAVGLRDSGKIYVENDSFEKNRNSILAFDSSFCRVSKNLFKQNRSGVFLYDESSLEAAENVFTDNDFAVRADNNSTAVLTGNVFVKNGRPVLSGIYSDVSVSKNKFIKNPAGVEYIATANPTTAGVISASEVWDGEVYLSGDIVVKAGSTLYIKSGTRISAMPSANDFSFFAQIRGENIEITKPGLVDVIVEGKLETEKGKNIFIDCPAGKWGGFTFVRESKGIFRNVFLADAAQAVNMFDACDVFFVNSRIKKSDEAANVYSRAYLNFEKSRIVDCRKGISVFESGICDVSMSIITGANVGLYVFSGGAGVASSLISKNKTGIEFNAGSLNLRDNTFLANEAAVYLNSPASLEKNRFYENGTNIIQK
ncbi:MAG: right-handed parallel beta-helix repeat-containing protein [Elusimicrobia bacterium]|nr:right-handed parallel beta-helix repeat-containing protein [Elusimicrobiota bacterium]